MASGYVKWTVKSPNGYTKHIKAYQSCSFCQDDEIGGIIFPLYDQGDGKDMNVLGLELNALAVGNAGLNPSSLIYQLTNDKLKVLVEVVPKAGKLQDVLDLLQNTYDLHYSSIPPNILNPNPTDFIINPSTISANGLSTIDVFFPINRLLELNGSAQIINFVRVLYPSARNAGIVTSQGDIAQKSNLVREAFKIKDGAGEIVEVDGSGVKIGVISDSFDTQLFTVKTKATVDKENGDLPKPANTTGSMNEVQVLKEYPYGDGFDEGRAMLQIIHDIAPGSSGLSYRGGVSQRFLN